jgi:outer membrane protein OmpA-like peptidoglycan-associated protein
MDRIIDWPRFSRWTWIVAALLIALLVGLAFAHRGPLDGACCAGQATLAPQAPSPSSSSTAEPEPPPAPTKTPGSFAVRIDGDQRVLDGTLADLAAKTSLLEAARSTWGEANVVDHLTVDAATSASMCTEKAAALFAALAADPPIGVVCDAEGRVTLTGGAYAEADKSARERWAHDFFGARTVVHDDIAIVAPPPPVTRPEDVRCGARMPAAVTFRTASSRIDAKGRALLDAITPCLKQGRYEIAGYTDSIGNDDDNLKLSKARAESVRAYMILKGVDAERLEAVGHGEEKPIGDNATREGRAANRRIEFTRK